MPSGEERFGLVARGGKTAKANRTLVSVIAPRSRKRTLVEILEGYRKRDAGEVSVLGMDPADGSLDFEQVRARRMGMGRFVESRIAEH